MAIPAHVINVGTSESVDMLVFGLGRYRLAGAPMVGMDGGVVGIVWGRWAVGRDEDGNWDFLEYVVAGVDLAKHLR